MGLIDYGLAAISPLGWAAKKAKEEADAGNSVKDQARAGANIQGGASAAFANLGQGNYDVATGQLNNTYGKLGQGLDYLGGVMRGQNSVSAEQLRQGLQQNLAAQRSMAASASPQNAAMAARTAAMQAGRLGAGLAGQQSLAGIQERNAAAAQYGQLGSALGQLQLGARGQDVNVALGARQNALQAYLGMLNGQQNESGTEHFMKTWGPAIGSAAQAAGA